jgi:cell division protein FtsI (penicillin-binding protein 3)
LKNKQQTSIRIWLTFIVISTLGLGIFSKVIYIQFAENKNWEQTVENFETQVRNIEPTRGEILARDGSLLAASVPEYEIRWDSKCEGLDKAKFMENLDSLAWHFAHYFGDQSSAEYKQIFLTALNQENRYARIKSKVNHIEVRDVKKFPVVKLPRYKSGFIFPKKDKRQNPFGILAFRTIGLDRDDQRVGLERAYNEQLAGKPGQQVQEKIPGGIWKPVSDDFLVEPVDGLDLLTTIDVHLQDIAENALLDQLKEHNAAWGCVVLMEVETGYVRAIANLERTSDADDEELTFFETYNFAIGQGCEPGSTFKLASMMAALESGLISPEDSIQTGNGIKKYYGSTIRDSNYDHGGHGKGSCEQIFEWSSNIGMAEIAQRCFASDKQAYLDRLKSFGLTQPLGLSIKGEKPPRIYEKVGDELWSGISHIWMSIGYEVEQTPLQILTFYNTVANNGRMMRPTFASALKKNGRVVEEIKPFVIKDKICSDLTLRQVRSMLEGVCEPGGTADHRFKGTPYKVAGKTGTAWIHNSGEYFSGHYRSSFVGYFPADNPKYSCIVVIHDPSSGSYYGSTIAAPVFKRLSDHLYATEFYSPQPETADEMLADTRVPISKNGSQKDLGIVFAQLNIKTDGTANGSWVRTSTKEDKVEFSDHEILNGLVPDVRGMGLQDALFLLENSGLTVKIVGSGSVKKQSLTAGSAIRKNMVIQIELG